MKNIYVGNLPFSAVESDIEQLFSQHGKVDRVSIVIDRETGRSRGFAFVEMSNDQEGDAAIAAMNGFDMGGRRLVVNEAQPREKRSGFGGGGGWRPRRLRGRWWWWTRWLRRRWWRPRRLRGRWWGRRRSRRIFARRGLVRAHPGQCPGTGIQIEFPLAPRLLANCGACCMFRGRARLGAVFPRAVLWATVRLRCPEP
jgi:cold-inducible RNA-binding protein